MAAKSFPLQAKHQRLPKSLKEFMPWAITDSYQLLLLYSSVMLTTICNFTAPINIELKRSHISMSNYPRTVPFSFHSFGLKGWKIVFPKVKIVFVRMENISF